MAKPEHRSRSTERQALTRQLLKSGQGPSEKNTDRPAYFDTPPYQPGGHFYENTPEGRQEYRDRQILAQSYLPGDRLIVDYAFGTYSHPIPKGGEAKFLGWVEYTFPEGDENLTYLGPEAKPGVYRNYDLLYVEFAEKKIMLGYPNVTLADSNLAAARLGEWGQQKVPAGFVRVGDLV